jgi:hypothetical protein
MGDEKNKALWLSIRQALLMIVAAIENFLELPADKCKAAKR